MNVVILTGKLTADPDLRYTSGGKSVCNMRLATKSRIRLSDGTWSDKPSYHKLVAWEGRAENMQKLLRKDDLVSIQGELTYSSWVDNRGDRRTTTQVLVNSFELHPPVAPEQPKPLDEIPF